MSGTKPERATLDSVRSNARKTAGDSVKPKTLKRTIVHTLFYICITHFGFGGSRESPKLFWWVNPLNFVYPYLEKRCFKNSKKIIANSNYVREQIILAYGIDESKIVTIYNGINLPQKVEKGEAKLSVCEEFGLDYSLPILLFVGNGFKRKGVKDFLRLVSKLKTPVNALIVGKDKNINSYKRLAKKLKIKAFL